MPVNRVFSAFDADRAFLCRLLETCPDGPVVEVGCLLGGTSVVLAGACERSGRTLYCVDPWDGGTDCSGEQNYQTFLERVKGFGPTVRVIRDRIERTRLLPDGIAFAFIDGSHYSPHPYVDAVKLYPLLAPNAVVAVHDSHDKGWGVNVVGSMEVFAEQTGVRLRYSVYHPTPDEERSHHHGVSGVCYFRKSTGYVK